MTDAPVQLDLGDGTSWPVGSETLSTSDEVYRRLLRYSGQAAAVYWSLRDGDWHTGDEVVESVRQQMHAHVKRQCVMANIRNLRKPQFGSNLIRSRRLDDGTWQYRLVGTTEVTT